MQKFTGFTLIELVVVIIILAILSIVAAPKFINIQKDAKLAALSGAQAALGSANKLVYSKAAIQGQEDVDSSNTRNIDLDNDGVNDIFGYYGLIKFVVAANELAGLGPELTLKKYYGGNQTGLPYFVIEFTDSPASITNQCFLSVYYPNSPGGNVNYQLVDDDC
ncbi:type II secretion system protein [Shewanella pneumatophori]|uniref:Type II secretion system GspH family protein n=1 Tax=Shewanella pneumatophori TaxID=314092 RepID=A0A9X1ZPU6_9GAMM|nr:type II secretion system protein [Shewanella pneumatophori]MCL1139791.1 type II secretion system GspH family protein [Shewanella pneumatophori]